MRLFLDTKMRLFNLFKIPVTMTTISTPKKSAKRSCLRSCNVKEEEHCSRLVVTHWDNFHKVRHTICRCVEAGPNPPHIRGPWHQNKWSILSECAAEKEMLPDIRAISGDFFIFQQDNAPAHRVRETVALLQREVPAFIAPNLWPPNSPDLNPVDYKVWGTMQDRDYRAKVRDVDDLKQRLVDVWDSLEQSVINDAINQ